MKLSELRNIIKDVLREESELNGDDIRRAFMETLVGEDFIPQTPHGHEINHANSEAARNVVKAKDLERKNAEDDKKKKTDAYLDTRLSHDGDNEDRAEEEKKTSEEKLKAAKMSLDAAKRKQAAVKQGGSM